MFLVFFPSWERKFRGYGGWFWRGKIPPCSFWEWWPIWKFQARFHLTGPIFHHVWKDDMHRLRSFLLLPVTSMAGIFSMIHADIHFDFFISNDQFITVTVPLTNDADSVGHKGRSYNFLLCLQSSLSQMIWKVRASIPVDPHRNNQTSGWILKFRKIANKASLLACIVLYWLSAQLNVFTAVF